MLISSRGNVLNGDCTIIAHVTNCEEKMVSKMGNDIANMYPEVEKADWSFEKRGSERMGKCSFALTRDYKKIMFNLYAQQKVHDELDYEAFKRAFETVFIIADKMEMKGFVIKLGVSSLIGCNWDDGGAEKEKIHEIIEKLSNRYGRTVYLYEDKIKENYK